MKQIVKRLKPYKIVLAVLLILTAISTVASVAVSKEEQKIINGTTNQTISDTHVTIEGLPPWDSISQVQSTSTRNIFMKIDYIPLTEWVDIEGYYDTLNYFQLPISVKLVNNTNVALKYQYVNIYIDEYKTWYEGGLFDCHCWRYSYITSYAKSRKTGSNGIAEFLFSVPYKGYDRTMYTIGIYYWAPNGDYTYYTKNTKVAWYINTAGAPPTKAEIENRNK